MEVLLADLRHTLRLLRRSPGFTAAAALTLALGLGASSAVFSVANWLALRPVPGVEDQRHLTTLALPPRGGVSYPNLADLRERIGAFSGLAGFSGTVPIVTHREGQTPRYLRGAMVSSQYFSVLGARLTVGRWFTPDEEMVAASGLVAVISHRLWSSMFGADTGALGGSLALNGVRAVVIGVAARGFHGAELHSDQDVWVPASAMAALAHLPGDLSGVMLSRGWSVFGQLVGRLAPEATLEQAQAQVGAAAAALVEMYPEENEQWKETPPRALRFSGVPPAARDGVRRVLILLAAVTALVVVIACTNVANLLLFRGVARRGEMAVRRALGGSVAQLIRSQLIEALVIAGTAGVAGLVVGMWITDLLRGLSLPGMQSLLAQYGDIGEVRPDWRLLVFGLSIALIAGAMVGLVPAIASARVDPMSGLKGTADRGSVRAGRLHDALGAFQVAVSVTLLVGALLLVGTLRNLSRIPIGFEADRVTAFAIWPPYSGYSRERSHTLLSDVLSRVRSIPGVEDAGFTAYPPFTISIGAEPLVAGVVRSDHGVPATSAWVSSGYFRAMGIPLLAGRDFRDDEMFVRVTPNAEGVAILSASHAASLFGTTDAVGRLVSGGNPRGTYRVVGVAQDARWESLTTERWGAPFYQPPPRVVEGGTLLVRSGLGTGPLQAAVQREISALAPSVPVFDVERMSDKVARSVSVQRLLGKVLSTFALLAVTLAGVGLYAVVAFSVAGRTREFGIRIALGAPAKQVLGMVLGQGARLAGVGLAVGLGGAAALSRLVASQLYGLRALELGVYAAASLLVLSLLFLATVIPARRATRVDPMLALRAE